MAKPRAKRATAHAFDTVESLTKKSTLRQPVPWPVCKHCGLVFFRNEASVKAARQPCPGLLDD